MKRNHRFGIAVFILSLSLLLAGCNGILSTPINKILENPRDYDNKHVRISGEVTEVFAFFVVKYFVVKDRTGEIMVVTNRLLPRKGAEITIKGTVREAFSIGDKQLLVIVEDEKK